MIGRRQVSLVVGRHLVLCESVLHSKRLFMIMNESPMFVKTLTTDDGKPNQMLTEMYLSVIAAEKGVCTA